MDEFLKDISTPYWWIAGVVVWMVSTVVSEFIFRWIDKLAGILSERTGGSSEDNREIQRVFKLAPTFEATEALLANGIQSLASEDRYKVLISIFTGLVAAIAGVVVQTKRKNYFYSGVLYIISFLSFYNVLRLLTGLLKRRFIIKRIRKKWEVEHEKVG